MPPISRYYRRQPWRYRRRPRTRRWIRYWRPRTTVLRRPFYRRRRYRVRRRRFIKNKKLRKIIVKEFQPKTIQKCKIKGFKCLIECGPDRESNNYAQYILSTFPENWPAGGGWSQMIFSLASLFEDNQHLLNIWTKSNAGLNLVRYLGASFRFYQHTTVDYIVIPRLCYPMTTSPLDHANSQPYRALLERKRMIIPSLATKPLRRRSRKFYFRPPSQLTNHWYFQKNLCNTPLLMLTTVGCSLNHLYINPKWTSTNITLLSLNTNFFQNNNFSELQPTTGYKPKPNIYMYTTGNGPEKPTSKNQLIYLGNTKDNTPGVVLSSEDKNKMENWGNPFNSHNLHPDVRIYTSTKSWNQLNGNISTDLTELTTPLLMKCRYTPEKDTGEGNEIYWVKNFADTGWQHPENFTLKIDGIPLYIALWGWIDYTKKIRDITRVDQDHLVIIKSNFFDTKLPAYVFLDEAFTKDKGPYDTEPSNYLLTHWHPQTQLQMKSINRICLSGPGTPKPPDKNSWEAHARYSFHFKWGGCPETLEKVYDPCSQQVYPIPNQLLQTTQINNPDTPIEHELYEFDWRRDQLTKTAAKRISKDQKTIDCLSSLTGLSKSVPETLQKERQEETTQEKTKKTLLKQLLQHRRNQLLIKHGILKLTSE